MKKIIFGLMVFTLSACASGGLIGQLPKVDGPPAEINLIRESALTGSGISYHMLLNGVNFFDIRVAQYTRFYVSNGEHILQMKTWESGNPLASVSIKADGNKIYYYILTTWPGRFDFHPITESQAIEYITAERDDKTKIYTYLQIDNTIGPLVK